MAHDETPAGFLSRWSRRKTDLREGRPLEEPPKEVSKEAVREVPSQARVETLQPNATQSAAEESPSQAAPTLEDVQQLTPQSNFSDYMAQGVAPEVKNAAMKKLFTDPHFNVMDRMDVYIDDYNQPDPLSPATLRQMASAKFLNLFEDEASQVVAQSDPVQNNSIQESTPHDHADLRLQPDPTTRPKDAGSEPV